jgi:hypothetical protein
VAHEGEVERGCQVAAEMVRPPVRRGPGGRDSRPSADRT